MRRPRIAQAVCERPDLGRTSFILSAPVALLSGRDVGIGCPKPHLWHRHSEPRLPARDDDRAPALHNPPSLDQTQPECPVAVIPRGGGKTAAFIDAPLEFIMAAVADDSERESL